MFHMHLPKYLSQIISAYKFIEETENAFRKILYDKKLKVVQLSEKFSKKQKKNDFRMKFV